VLINPRSQFPSHDCPHHFVGHDKHETYTSITQLPKAKFGTKIHQGSSTDFSLPATQKNTTLQFPRWKQDNAQALSSIRYISAYSSNSVA
jgi:hypothetical protein